MALESTQPLVKMSTRNILGDKGGRCVRLTSPPSRAECHEIWAPKTSWKHLGHTGPVTGLLCLTFYRIDYAIFGVDENIPLKLNLKTWGVTIWKGFTLLKIQNVGVCEHGNDIRII